MSNYPDYAYLQRLAREAGLILNTHFENAGSSLEVTTKSDRTPVTEADMAVNQLVLDSIEEDFPSISVWAEEGSRILDGADHIVICDPLDGTAAFSKGVIFFSFCIAVVDKLGPLSAVIYEPVKKKMWWAEKGKGAFLNGKPIQVSQKASLEGSEISIIDSPGTAGWVTRMRLRLMEQKVMPFSPQSLAYAGALVGQGLLDATIFKVSKPFETAAMQLIVEEAGGKATDLRGQPLRYRPGEVMRGHIISNRLLHDELVRVAEVCGK